MNKQTLVILQSYITQGLLQFDFTPEGIQCDFDLTEPQIEELIVAEKGALSSEPLETQFKEVLKTFVDQVIETTKEKK